MAMLLWYQKLLGNLSQILHSQTPSAAVALLQADEMTDERTEMKNIPAIQKAAAVQ